MNGIIKVKVKLAIVKYLLTMYRERTKVLKYPFKYNIALQYMRLVFQGDAQIVRQVFGHT